MAIAKEPETLSENTLDARSTFRPASKVRRSVRYRFLLTGVGFALLLISPSVDQWLGFSAGFKSTEKNILKPFPRFKFPHVQTYIHQFNQYYKENFGWRNALFYQYSHLKYTVFGVSPLPQKVVIGKNEWFYPGNDLSNVADQHQGLQPISLKTLRTIAEKLIDKQRKMSQQGTAFYLVIAPDSYSIYPENLPDYLHTTRSTSNLDYLKRYLKKHTSIPFIDIRPNLLAAKSIHPTYMHTDTHWNDYGAFVATMAIMKRIRQDFPAMPAADEKACTVRAKKGYSGDLAVMLALNQAVWDKTNYQIDLPVSLRAKEVQKIANTELGGWPSQRFVSTNVDAPDLLFVGDSFTLSLRQFVPGYFSHSYIVRSNSLTDKLISSEKPDVVILEIVERNITNLADI